MSDNRKQQRIKNNSPPEKNSLNHCNKEFICKITFQDGAKPLIGVHYSKKEYEKIREEILEFFKKINQVP